MDLHFATLLARDTAVRECQAFLDKQYATELVAPLLNIDSEHQPLDF
jgi:hypothetical protein